MAGQPGGEDSVEVGVGTGIEGRAHEGGEGAPEAAADETVEARDAEVEKEHSTTTSRRDGTAKPVSRPRVEGDRTRGLHTQKRSRWISRGS